MSSKNIYIPYFYIIRHIKSGKLYAGSRWAKGCHPDEFMKLNGYTTSSKYVNSIIDQEGIDSFEILRIDTYCDNIPVNLYETIFLQTLNCASDKNWINSHNNNNYNLTFGSDTFKNSMITKYGIDNPSKDPQIILKGVKSRIKTNLERYEVATIFKIPEYIESMKESRIKTNLERYGHENVFQNKEIIDKQESTMMKKYGVKKALQNKEILNCAKNKEKETLMERYGVTHNWNIPEVKEKLQKTENLL